MKYLLFIYHLILFIIKLLIYFILLPIFFIWVLIKRKRFLSIFSKELRKYGIDKKSICKFKKYTFKLREILKFIKLNDIKTLSK